MDPDTGQSRGSSSAPGAALILSLASFAIVGLSIALLFGYSSGVTDCQDGLENSAQAMLTHSGALEYAMMKLESGGVSPGEPISSVSTGGMVTVFDVSGLSPMESRTLDIPMPGSTDRLLVPTWDGILAVGRDESGFEAVLVRHGSGLRNAGFPVGIGLPETPDHWTLSGCMTEGGAVAAIACGWQGCDTLFAIGPDGSVESYPLDGLDLTPSSVLTIGSFEGRTSAVITDGTNRALLVDLAGRAPNSPVHSPVGTCPVISNGYDLFGDISVSFADDTSSDHMIVHDVFTGDFNQDGSLDLAWAGPSSMACLLSGGGNLQVDEIEDGKLIAWGFLEGRYGLGGLWELNDGRLAWRKQIWSGFQVLPAAGAALSGYGGRLVFDGEAFYGTSSGLLSISETPLAERVVMTFPEGITADFDLSGGLDVAVPGDGSVTIHFDPAGSGGMEFELGISTGYPGADPIISETRSVLVLTGTSGIDGVRIFLTGGSEA